MTVSIPFGSKEIIGKTKSFLFLTVALGKKTPQTPPMLVDEAFNSYRLQAGFQLTSCFTDNLGGLVFNRGPLARSNTADGVMSLSSSLKKVSWPYHEQIKIWLIRVHQDTLTYCLHLI